MTVLSLSVQRLKLCASWSWCYLTLLKKLGFHFLLLAAWLIVELILPIKGWSQAIRDATFLGTGTISPYYLPINFFRAPLQEGVLQPKGVRAGPVTLHPFLGLAQTFSDNTFATKKDRKSDTVTTIAPGLQAYYPFLDQHFALVDYRAAQRFNYRFSQNNALSQEALGRLSLSFPVGLKVNFQGGHTEGFDARGSEEDIQLQDQTTWNTNFLFGQAEYIGSRTGAQIRFRTIKWNFENNGQDVPRDNIRHSVNLSTYIRATKKTYAVLGFGIAKTDFDDNKQLDSFAYTVSSGFRVPASDQITGEVNIGYTVLNFDRAPLATSPGPGLSAGANGSQALFIRGIFSWRPTSLLSVTFRPIRTINQSAVFNSSSNTRTGGYIQASQQLPNRFGLTGVVYYNHNQFSGGNSRTDHLYQARIGFDYRTVKWLGFQIQYMFQGRQSTNSNFDYYANAVMFSIQGML
ncbi:MAG: outer membrane beta-barrel protein [Nitrospirales bacterium]